MTRGSNSTSHFSGRFTRSVGRKTPFSNTAWIVFIEFSQMTRNGRIGLVPTTRSCYRNASQGPLLWKSMSATDRLREEQVFHDRQARERAAWFGRHPESLRFDDDTYLDHETWIRPGFAQLGDVA